MTIKSKVTGLVLSVGDVRGHDAMCYDAKQRLYRLSLAEMMKEYELMEE